MAHTRKHAMICTAWKRMQAEGCDPVWNDYGAFREWSEHRWADKAVFAKIFPELPWGPDNAEWIGGHDPDAWTITWSRQYRRTPAQTVNPCTNCRSLLQCTKICPARARWWDHQTASIRKALKL